MIHFNGENNIQEVHYNGRDIRTVYDHLGKVWEKRPPDYPNEYLTVRVLDGNSEAMINFVSNSGCTVDLKYSLNGGSWTTYTQPISGLQEADVVRFKGHVVQQTDAGPYGKYGSFSFNYRNVEVEGNVMSLLYEDNFSGQTDLMYPWIFSGMFSLSLSLIGLLNAENLILPATALTDCCYSNMFYNCAVLQTAPQLPATTLADSCYYQMFAKCGVLQTAPTLPATTLADNCYVGMFNGCKALETAPELPATTLAYASYLRMFANCDNLNYIKCMASDISATSCTTQWLDGVAANGTFVTPSSTTWSSGIDGIPQNWTRVDL